MIKVKITTPDIQCEISQDIDKNDYELKQLIQIFELALRGCGFEFGDKKLELTESD